METIKVYIETMFKGVADNREMRDLKDEIASNMQERYKELKEQGKSENEAIGTVISEFGNIDELLSEMGCEAVDMQSNAERKVLMASRDEVLAYIRDSKILGRRVALGVGIILCCVALLTLVGGFENFFNLGSSVDMTFSIFLIMGVCVAVGLFIYYGLKMEKYEHIESGEMKLDSATFMLVEKEFKSKKDTYNIHIVIGVVLCIFSVIPVIIGEYILPNLGEDIGTGIMLFIIAIAVHFFITTGVEMSAYDDLIKKNEVKGDEKYLSGDYDHTIPESVQAAKWIGRIHGIMWPIVVGIYLYMGFFRNLWHPGWLIFAIAGVMSPVIAVVVNILIERKK